MTTTAPASDSALRRLAKQHDAGAIRELVDRQLSGAIDAPLWREPSSVRLRVADEFVGAVVDVDVDRLRTPGAEVDTVRARLVSSAYGGTSGAIVLRFPAEANLRDRLVELALVRRIRRAPVGAALAATYPR
jgi:hypothetical protein